MKNVVSIGGEDFDPTAVFTKQTPQIQERLYDGILYYTILYAQGWIVCPRNLKFNEIISPQHERFLKKTLRPYEVSSSSQSHNLLRQGGVCSGVYGGVLGRLMPPRGLLCVGQYISNRD